MSMSKFRHKGFTLIEVVIFIVVVSAGLAGILAVSNTVVRSSADPMVRKQAVAVAESMLEEIVLKEYANPVGGYAGVDRAQFDDVDDYAGYATTGIRDVSGSAVAGLERYNVAVAVAATTDLTGVAAKEITVSVTVTGSNEAISLTGYRSNY